MNNLVPFTFESNEIRIVMVNNEPWVIIADIAKAIGHSNPSELVKLVDEDDLRKVEVIDSIGRKQQAWAVDEPGLYQILLSTTVEKAKPFRKWVTAEVLPAIRKTGSYSLTQPPLGAPVLKDQLEAATLLGAPWHLSQIEAVKATRKLTGADYSNYLLIAPAQNNIPKEEQMLEPLDLGKKFGVSGIAINRLLKDHGYQNKEEMGWVPTELGKAYCTTHAWTKGNKSGYNLKWRVDLIDTLLSVPEEEAA